MSFYLSIDPGNKKCGILLANVQSGEVVEAGIASVNKFSDLVTLWSKNYKICKIIIGDGTNCKFVKNELKRKKIYDLNFVNEKGSTLRARFKYWEIWPPNYFIRWIPRGILFPPDNLDAIVALVLLEDFLNFSLIWPEKMDIKIWP